MKSLNVSTEIPKQITKGLESGIYERIGGAIREVDSLQIIAWLREASNLSEPVISKVLSLSSTTSNASALNLALTTMEFAVVMKRLDAIEKQLYQLQKVLDAIDYKIDLSFYANFRAALDLAVNAFTMTNAETRRVSSMQAINRFLEAEHHYTNLSDIEISNQSQVADDYLSTLCLAYVTEVRCYLELDELETAIQRLQDGLNVLRPRFEAHAKTLLTSNPSAYLHPCLKRQIGLKRLTNVYRWLTPGIDETTVFEAQRDNIVQLIQHPQDCENALPPAIRLPVKSRFFSKKIIAEFAGQFGKKHWARGVRDFIDHLPSKAGRQIKKEIPQDSDDEIFSRLPETMQLIEAMIENCSRFEIYLSELIAVRKLGMTFKEWRQISPKDMPEPRAGALICIAVPPNTAPC